jgi:glycogen debranching enzyme
MKAPEKRLISEAGKRALEVMHACSTPNGFCASAPGHGFHYPEIWARDNGIMALGALASGEPDLISVSRHYLECMSAHQTPLGMIPINVDTAKQRMNKENAPPVDGNLWYILAHYALYEQNQDQAWLQQCFPNLCKAYQWLRYHEWHEDGLLAIPRAGNWMDQFTVQGITLYDNALWYAASLAFEAICTVCDSYQGADILRAPVDIRERLNELMWVHRCWNPYHFAERLEKIRQWNDGWMNAHHVAGNATSTDYYIPWIAYRDSATQCYGLDNVLAVLCGVANEERAHIILNYMHRTGMDHPYPLKTIDVPIYPHARGWHDFFEHRALNWPGRYHNGGIWPMIGGFYVAALVFRKRQREAEAALVKLAQANRLGSTGEQTWEFNEWLCVNGDSATPCGAVHQGWSASSFLFAMHAVEAGAMPLFGSLAGRVPALVS